MEQSIKLEGTVQVFTDCKMKVEGYAEIYPKMQDGNIQIADWHAEKQPWWKNISK